MLMTSATCLACKHICNPPMNLEICNPKDVSIDHTDTPTTSVTYSAISPQVRRLLLRNWAHENTHDLGYMSSKHTHNRHTHEPQDMLTEAHLHPPHTHTHIYHSRDVFGHISASTQTLGDTHSIGPVWRILPTHYTHTRSSNTTPELSTI
jgi:hypothetical protein